MSDPTTSQEHQETHEEKTNKNTVYTLKVFRQITDVFEKGAHWYQKLGAGGFLIVASITIVLVTIGFSFLTGTNEPSTSGLGITFKEEALFIGISAVFAALGIFSVHHKNVLASSNSLKILEHQLGIHKEGREAKLKSIEAIIQLGGQNEIQPTDRQKLINELIQTRWED